MEPTPSSSSPSAPADLTTTAMPDEDDGYLAYMRDVRALAERQPLLTEDEERTLGQRIRAGMLPLPHRDGTKKGSLVYHYGPPTADALAAWEELVTRNLRLVIRMASAAARRTRKLEITDLIQAGNLGLMRAARKFDPARGNRFSTLATWWIRQAIAAEITDHDRTARTPRYLHARARRHLMTPDALSLDLPVELDAHNRTITLGETVAAPGGDMADAAIDRVSNEQSGAVLRQAMADALTARERQVIEMRFDEGLTLDQTGCALSITRERARQIEMDALRKLRGALELDRETGTPRATAAAAAKPSRTVREQQEEPGRVVA